MDIINIDCVRTAKTMKQTLVKYMYDIPIA